ncbi:MAG: energy-coupling factor transporter transmembrane component T [Bacilli bacterium]|nr:energy-coupling factor transporter transmembrane component T [Bacilli bacterium]
MLNNVAIGRYYSINSPVHSLNPIIKIIGTLLFIISVFFANTLTSNLGLFFMVTFMAVLSKVPSSVYFKTLKSLRGLLIALFIINIIMGVGIKETAIIAVRLIFIVIYTSMLTLTTSPTEITYGLEKVFSPLKIIKIPVNKMALSLSLAIRFIPTILDQADKILKSQASRGIDYNNSKIKGKFMALNAMLYPMFSLSIKRADDLADAMEVRLFSINSKRTNYRINKIKIFDILVLLLHIGIIFLAISKGVII